MLLSLRIENFALVDYLELNLGTGMTVMTGETGAGKSIILDAIDAALGGKVTSRVVRTGTDRALIEATFRLDSHLETWLQQQEIDIIDEQTLVCSREITISQGTQRNRSRINGVLVNKQQIEALREHLVEITAQGQTVQIGQPPLQREWLDSYGGAPLLQQRDRVGLAYAAYHQALQALEKRRKSEQDRLQLLDQIEYKLNELNNANLQDPEELEQLAQEEKRLNHSVTLKQQSYEVGQAIYENESGTDACLDLLGQAEATLQDMVEYDSQIQPILELVSNALAQVNQAGREIRLYGDSLEADPDRLGEVQMRMMELKQICRKYGPTLADAIALQEQLQSQLEELNGGGESLEQLEHTYQQRQTELTQVCAQLTQIRQSTASNLEARLVNELKPLAMEKVKFQVEVTPCPPTALGADRIRFLFSPNPGEPLQPLTEIASGGEMSRFLLALQACFSQVDSVGTLVFDEIDVGVSGRVTQAIAEKLHQLSQYHQVLCVTHQPIVAAIADQHFRVTKQVIGADPGDTSETPEADPTPVKGKGRKGKASKTVPVLPEAPEQNPDVRTVVRVAALDQQQRRQELAQLAGGASVQARGVVDTAAYAFAESLLNQAATLRQIPAEQPQQSVSSQTASPKTKSAKTKISRQA